MFDWLNVIQTQKEQGKTQQQIGESIGWSQRRVADYCKIKSCVSADVLKKAKSNQEGRALENSATALNFTEGWFRNSGIYDLQPERQQNVRFWACLGWF